MRHKPHRKPVLATRCGRPAYLAAPQRLRASQIEAPFYPDKPQPGLLARLLARGMGRGA